MESDLLGVAAKFDFYQELKSHISGLIEFIMSKSVEVGEFSDLVLGERRKMLQFSLAQRLRTFEKDLVFMNTNIPSVVMDESMEDIMEEDEMEDEKEAIFNDVVPIFSSLNESIIAFEKWKIEYPLDFSESFGYASITPALDIYIKYELSVWKPFTVFQFN